MTVHRIIMTTHEVATLHELIKDRMEEIDEGKITYGSPEENRKMIEELQSLRTRLGDEVQAAWGPKAEVPSS